MKIALYIFSIFMILAGLIPFVKKDNWTIRIFDYPRFQKLLICIVLIIIWISFEFAFGFNFDTFLFFSLIGISLYLFYAIYPFTVFGRKMVMPAKEGQGNCPNISVLVMNVFQFNTKYHKVVSLVKEVNPDVVLLVETDTKWEKGIQELEKEYKDSIKKPLDNTYGMLFYSKLKITSSEIHFLIDAEIPSMEIDVELSNGSGVKIYAIHPTPPVPGENPKSTERDAEILLVGKKAKEYGKPALVMGDLNDVGWSYTSKLFLKTSGFLDPRIGRGMYNTFNAKYFFLRWPLDHIFVSKHFTLNKINVEKSIGSDHFPISSKFTLQPQNENEELETDAKSEQKAEEKINKGKGQ
ncbi:endonuclease/exonuclease/phosphatase family protein [Aquiflexum sp. TKW24L]|uniref:endonuclease/exonuclease/phosphatase family protein n=1 Tax=Aquiflexum sp. TKW24L TaxID=2942212 RepID=UPI0020BD87B1|nr:endonuclease/exonuclease/phosphatase family protein [Aquiflexum sp. TKW24L]MCL6259035.1 endonuclease/exonuclease/phosphatase family protein [Aquiflexum sp. TKW24L]